MVHVYHSRQANGKPLSLPLVICINSYTFSHYLFRQYTVKVCYVTAVLYSPLIEM